jgi:hypothetical protein
MRVGDGHHQLIGLAHIEARHFPDDLLVAQERISAVALACASARVGLDEVLEILRFIWSSSLICDHGWRYPWPARLNSGPCFQIEGTLILCEGKNRAS